MANVDSLLSPTASPIRYLQGEITEKLILCGQLWFAVKLLSRVVSWRNVKLCRNMFSPIEHRRLHKFLSAAPLIGIVINVRCWNTSKCVWWWWWIEVYLPSTFPHTFNRDSLTMLPRVAQWALHKQCVAIQLKKMEKCCNVMNHLNFTKPLEKSSLLLWALLFLEWQNCATNCVHNRESDERIAGGKHFSMLPDY